MNPRGNSITEQVIRLHRVGEHDLADEIERVQVRNNHMPDPEYVTRWGWLVA